MKVLLSIKPEFALPIFDGIKGFEYRRAIFRRPVKSVVVYVSSPVQRVIGEFEVEALFSDDIDRLWRRTKHLSGISKDTFYSYFSNKTEGFAIKIGKTKRYRRPKHLYEIYGMHPPQSFVYLAQDK